MGKPINEMTVLEIETELGEIVTDSVRKETIEERLGEIYKGQRIL